MNESRRARAATFLKKHQRGTRVVVANAWDALSAKLLAQEPFDAIATTSAGIAFSLGRPDGEHVRREQMLDVVRAIAGAVELPVSADVESGYGRAPATVAETIFLAIKAGADGANVEDCDKRLGFGPQSLFSLELAMDRVRAARQAATSTGSPFVLNARTNAYVYGDHSRKALAELVRRTNAYSECGADCVFIPGLHRDPGALRTLVKESSVPLNVLLEPGGPRLDELWELGVTRVSCGTSLLRVAYSALVEAGKEMIGRGRVSLDDEGLTNPQLHALWGVAPYPPPRASKARPAVKSRKQPTKRENARARPAVRGRRI